MTSLSPLSDQSPVIQAAYRSRAAAADLAPLPRAAKDDALLAIADALEVRSSEIVEANAEDVAKARAAGTAETVIDRLTLTPSASARSPVMYGTSRRCPTRSARSYGARRCPTESTCARCGCRSASSGSSTRPGPM